MGASYANPEMGGDEQAPRVGVGAVILDGDGRLLVIKRGNPPRRGRWTLPGGKLQRGETIVEAIAREVREETGLEVEVGGLVGLLEWIGEDHHYVIVDHRAAVVGGELGRGDDADDVAWMSRDELAEVATTDGLLAFLDDHGVPLR